MGVATAVLLWALWPLWHSLTQGTELVQHIHPEVLLQQALSDGCWLFFCPLINYDPLGWSQNNRNITRFSPNPLVGLRNCFLLFSSHVKMFSQPLGHKIFLADFLLLIPWLEEQEAGWSFEASLDSIIFNLEPSAPKIQNKIRSRQNFSIVHSELSSHCQIRRLDLPFPGSRQNIFMKPRIAGKDD